MKIKKISLILCLLLIVLCLVGCKDAEGNSDLSSNLGTTSGVPIVIVDEDDSENSQSELDEILNDWENNNPTIDIEIDTADNGDNSNSYNNNSGGTSTNSSSDVEENDSSSDDFVSSNSQDQGSSENSSDDDVSNTSSTDNSSNTDSSDTGSEDDGYFDVAV